MYVFTAVFPSVALSDIRRYRDSGTLQLTGEAELLLSRIGSSKLIDHLHDIHACLPDPQVSVATNSQSGLLILAPSPYHPTPSP